MSSKRNALRYKCENETILIRTAYEDGEASLVNISTTGCAIQSPSATVSLDEKVLFTFSIEKEETIQIQAKVIRIDNEEIGAEFTLIEPEAAELLRKHYALMQRERKQKNS